MEKVTTKPNWQLSWGLWWRMVLITLGIYVIVGAIIFAVLGPTLFALLSQLGGMPGGW